MLSAFHAADVTAFIARIRTLTPEAKPQWGTMTAPQMLAHCNVTYALIYEPPVSRPPAWVRWLLRRLIKPVVVGAAPYRHNSRTASYFKVGTDKDFTVERDRLIGFIERTRDLGAAHFAGLESHSFGPLTTEEWDRMFSKHLEHHLAQFGV